jgi:RNA polymerase sigma factor (sigma-70 family)
VNSLTDQQLLRDYAERQSEAAFTELVRRHIDLVYSAALRMVCDSHRAQDVTQGVFIALAQSAPRLTEHPVLSGWLHRTAQNLAAKAVRTEVRRHAREQKAVTMNQLNETDATWETIAPQLDTALGELPEMDRDALLLRYFEHKTVREMAGILGTSEDAAQKRVNRAEEKLRELFTRRRIAIGAGGMAALISVNAVQAAPVGLVSTISAAALAGSAVQISTFVAATKTIAMTTLQKSIIVAALASVAGTGLYAAHQNTKLRGEIQTLRQQQAPLTEQIQELRQERDDATDQLTAIQSENAQLESNSNKMELLRLRGEVTRLENSHAEANDDPAMSTAKAMAARVNMLKDWLAQHPDKNIPEVKLLSDQEWLRLAATFSALDTDEEIRQAMGSIRENAKYHLAGDIGEALDDYISHNNGQLPNAMQDLMPYFEASAEADNTILARYQILQTGNLNQFSPSEPLIAETAPPVDDTYDMIFKIGAFSFSYQDVSGRLGGGGSHALSPSAIRDIQKFARQ